MPISCSLVVFEIVFIRSEPVPAKVAPGVESNPTKSNGLAPRSRIVPFCLWLIPLTAHRLPGRAPSAA